MRLVFDTSVLVSRVLRPSSVPGRAFARAEDEHTILIAEPAIAELTAVLARPKFRAYVTATSVARFIQSLAGIGETVAVTAHVEACRDPNDDKILALAVSGLADAVISGDADLLVLDPFQGIRILSPRQFLDQ